LKNISSRTQTNDFNLCLIKFISKSPNLFPTIKEIEFLTDVAVSYSDLIPIPLIEVRIDDSNFTRFIRYIESSCDVIEELNQKPIMGALPSLPREQYPKLEFYLDKDITTFYFDFNGSTPDHLKLRPILRYLKKKKVLERTFIYGINCKPQKDKKSI